MLMSLLCATAMDEGMVQVGKTKAFFGRGILEELEDNRNVQLNARAIKLQAHYRGYRAASYLRSCVQEINPMGAFSRST